jgi:DUF1680 family protein
MKKSDAEQQFHSLSRRNFLATIAGTASALAVMNPGLAFAQDALLDKPLHNTGGAREKIAWKVQPFPLSQVQLRSGPLKEAREINRRYLLEVPSDRLLHMFRLTAGQASAAEPLGGWEAPDCELRGHFAGGHYLSACALMFASSRDEALRSKGNSLVTELAKCQKPNGYLGAYSEEFYDRLKNHQKVWAPFYTYHKIMAGHLDMYVHCGNEQALQTITRMADWAYDWIMPISDEELARIQKVEFGGMTEVLFNLYAINGQEKYAVLARRFGKKAFFDPLAERQDHLAGLHANTHIPQVIGAARGYELTADERYHTISDYFWHEVVDHHCYSTGGTSDGEGWQEPDKLAKQLGPAAEECCCSYNMMKLSRHVYGWTVDPKVMDYYERLLFNVRLGTQDRNGMLMYYVSLQPGKWKTFGTEFGAFWCCTGTGVEEFAKSNDTIYFHDAESLYVNLFIGSEVQWTEKNLTLVQDTNFPQEEATTLTIRAPSPTIFSLKIRIPYWATRGVSIHVNGQPQHIASAPSTYAELRRKWREGDKVEIAFPMSLHASPLPDDHTIQAAMYGPLVLAAQMGKEGLTEQMIYGDSGPFTEHQKEISMLELTVARGAGPEKSLEPVPGESLRFQTTGHNEAVSLMPLYQFMDERYSVYLKVHEKEV